MQTLRKRSSPCKYKNEPSRFLGEGMTFKAKLIGILEVNEARGDKMCQDALNDLKTAIRAAGEHKQRITISIAIDGLRLRDEKSGDCLYHHPVHKISFIAQDMSDSRAFGYIFGSPDTGHRFFGIKTDKTASQVVISMRDLFQVVFELKKKEIEMAKHHIEQRQIKYGTTANTDSLHSIKDDYDTDKKGKYPQLIKIRCVTSKSADSSGAAKANTSEAIADLLDLEHELNSIQQGINQMDRITPSDPFGPLSKGDPFLDPFEDSFSSKIENITSEVKVPPPVSSKTVGKTRSASQSIDSPPEQDKQSNLFGSSATSGKSFFSQFSPQGISKANQQETHWFDQETESLFNDRTNVSNPEPTSSPVTFAAEKIDSDHQQSEEKKSPMKPDVFMELDPLGTGWVKPYIDKKDFFQELKNPPKKVLKELLTENSTTEPANYFSTHLETTKNASSTPSKEQSALKTTITSTSSNILSSFPSAKDSSSKYSKIDPFDDSDPFEKTDPFAEKNFPHPSGLPSLFNGKSFDGVFSEPYDKPTKEEEITSPSRSNIFSPNSIHGPLRVSLPPEKADTNTPISLSSITSKFRSSPSPPDESKTLRRKNYQVLKQSAEDKADESSRSPVQDEFFCTSRSPKVSSAYSPKSQGKSIKEKSFSVQSVPSNKPEKMTKFWSDDFSDSTPNPPPKPKAALFSIKPPPLPPKKQNQPNFKPPARPPSLEDNSHYDYLKNQEEANRLPEPRSPKLDNQKTKSELCKQSERSTFPLLPPPPQRKTPVEKSEAKPQATGSILNITLNQLDNSGLENLAVTLGISSDHIYNMTLQELTKRLSEKYLNPKENKQLDSFEADFESNFSKVEPVSNNAPTYDKYAVFKELIENDNKKVTEEEERPEEVPEASSPSVAKQEDEEDRYAALRQLSMRKSENLSEDLDLSVEEDSSNRADNLSDIRPKTADSFTPMNSVELATDSPVIKSATDWSGEAFAEEKREDAEVDQIGSESAEVPKSESMDASEEPKSDFQTFDEKQQEEKVEDPRENWATFDKASVFEEPVQRKPAEETGNDNENSPFSSDGKEDSFNWHKKKSKQRGRDPSLWDEDESWDEYSLKESYWSDESSHDDRSPDKRRDARYQRRQWNKQMRKSKGMTDQWSRRSKWNEDTEDEYEESWNHRCRMGSCDKGETCGLSYDTYEVSYEWCGNSRSEPWEENDRYPRCYTERRKRSESDDEYRRRCDSDTSDREYIWTFKGRSEKPKQYHKMAYTARDYPERCHEPRSKHRKGESHKRPSSASEGKRNYEKMYSPGDHLPKGKRGTPEDDLSPSYHKDFRFCCGPDYYSSFDRRQKLNQCKKTNRCNRRNDSTEQYPETKEAKGDYYESSWHKSPDDNRRRHFQFEDDFAPEKSSKMRDASKSPRKKQREDWSGKEGFFQPDNNNESFARFGKKEEPVAKPHPGKNHFTRQESSASLRKSESINIFSRENDPFEGDDFFSSSPANANKLGRFSSEKSKSNSNVNDAFAWKEVFGDSSFHD